MAERIGRVVADQLMEHAKDPERVGAVLSTWSDEFKKIVGGAVLRVLWWVVGTALVIGSIKLGLLDKLHQAFGGGPKP